MAITVTLIGGESSGKSTLAQALQRELKEQHGIPTALVSEQLRQWCETHGRAPLAHEQAARAAEQSAAIAAAAADPGTQVVVADTTALVIAAYSEQYFGDRSLWPEALAQQRAHQLTLLTGLDLPWVPDGLLRDGPQAREQTDALLRRELQAAGLPFQTVYGPVDSRVRQALRSLGPLLGRRLLPPDTEWGAGRYRWTCERCGDPVCEHRVFTGQA